MTIVAPVAIPAAGLPLPDPADKTTFSARKLEQLRWANNEYSTYSLGLGNAAYSNALDAQASASNSAASAAAAAATVASAALATGVIQWVTLTTYAVGDCRFSPINYQTYRRKTAGAGSTDPSADPTNWSAIGVTSVNGSTGVVTIAPAVGSILYLNQLYGVF